MEPKPAPEEVPQKGPLEIDTGDLNAKPEVNYGDGPSTPFEPHPEKPFRPAPVPEREAPEPDREIKKYRS
jgi:hypothetical protein